MISGYMGRSDRVDLALCTFARRYADQTEADHAAMGAAVDRGMLPVERGVSPPRWLGVRGEEPRLLGRHVRRRTVSLAFPLVLWGVIGVVAGIAAVDFLTSGSQAAVNRDGLCPRSTAFQPAEARHLASASEPPQELAGPVVLRIGQNLFG